MREAEKKFRQGLENMKGKPKPEEYHIGSTGSYRSCDDAPEENPKSQGSQGKNGRNDLGKPAEDGNLWGKKVVGETNTETLRSVDLPHLPLETSALGFGDWLTLIDPMIADISYSSGEWWSFVMEEVRKIRKTYEDWLQKDPLVGLDFRSNERKR